MSLTQTLHPVRPKHWPLLFGLILLFSAAYWLSSQHLRQDRRDRMEMKKSSGKNEPHVNQKARDRANEEYEKAKEEFEKLDTKRLKSKEDKALRKKLRKKVEHWRKKKDWTGENHSQKHKGN